MNFITFISLLQSLQAVVADLKAAGVVDLFEKDLPELEKLITDAEAVFKKVDLQKIEGELAQAFGRIQDIMKKP